MAGESDTTNPVATDDSGQAPRAVDRVVAVGTSAGGLQALQLLSRGLEISQGICVVVAQTLAQERRSLPVELLDRETQFTVVPAAAGMPLTADTIILAPPDHDVVIDECTLHISEAGAGLGPRPSLDALFMSVATYWGSHGIGVVLSGAGSDGAHGLRAIQAAEGLTIAQRPDSARLESMPRAAIELAHADLVLDPEDIGPALCRPAAGGSTHAYPASPPPGSDIGDRPAGKEASADLALVLASVFDTEVFGVAVLDADNRVVRINDALCTMLGRKRAYVTGTAFDSFRELDPTRSRLTQILADKDSGVSVQRLRTPQGTTWAAIDIRPLPRPVGQATAIAIVQDVTALQQSTEALERLARFDSATGLANRDFFRVYVKNQIKEAEEGGEPFALLWLDLDRFKDVNDQYGHPTGDVVLEVVAQRLESAVQGRGLVGRAGGDEFTLLIPGDTAAGHLDIVLSEVMSTIGQPIPDESGAQILVTGSVGIALYPADGQSADSLMRSADQAMYAAKATGGNTSRFFQQDMNTQAEHRRRMRHQLAVAINDRAFQMYYQPIVDPRDGSVHGAEALCRWVQDDEVVRADRFIAFSQASGQIRELGVITLELVQQDVHDLRAAGIVSLPVSVNLSVTQLADPRHLELLRSWPQPSRLAGIEVEVTESVFLPDNSRAAEAVAQIAAIGATIAVDDFGTGFSNLRMLQSLAPAKIKLDQSFLSAQDDPERGRNLMNVAIHMAHTLGAVVIAEGVESQAQQDLAQELGADLVQGSHIAEPMPLDELVRWLESRNVGAAGSR